MFNLNGVEWELVLTSPIHPKLFRSDGTLSIGACDNDTHTVYINENLQGPRLKKVLAHEITHAAMFSYGVTLTLDQEELLADLLATYGEEIIATTNKVFRKMKKWELT